MFMQKCNSNIGILRFLAHGELDLANSLNSSLEMMHIGVEVIHFYVTCAHHSLKANVGKRIYFIDFGPLRAN